MTGFADISADGIRLQVEDNLPLLAVLNARDFAVSALCYHPQTGYQGRCSLCVIEILKGGKWETKHACALYAQPGMELRTQSPRIQELRARAASLLLLHGPYNDSTLENKLQALASAAPPTLSIAYQSPPGCLLCGRCIAICRKIGKNKLTFLGRGSKLRVSFVDNTSTLQGCGNCHACRKHCPAGFIRINGESAFQARFYP